MTVLVTGAAGFIGFHVSRALLSRNRSVIGIDNMNDYYDVNLKKARLKELEGDDNFSFKKLDFADHDALFEAFEGKQLDQIVHLGAQAGVRYSLDAPFAYAQANLVGHLSILELARRQANLKHLVYASSSSVYGGNTKMPFAESDFVDHPVSLYAATKKSDELLSQSYSHLYGIPQTGLRFFTVYGPWGRPDMAYWLFTEALFENRPIRLFNQGNMSRDFSYIDDVVAGILTCLESPAQPQAGGAPHKVYNIGGGRPEDLSKMVEIIERETGIVAEKILAPMQPGDVEKTFADISSIRNDLGFEPTTTIDQGLPEFVKWYRTYRGL